MIGQKKMLPLISLASETRRAGVALFSSLSEIAECIFFNPGKQASCLHLRAEVSWVGFVCRVWCKCFYFCLFNLCAFTLCLPFGASLNLAFLQIPNSQQISALPSVFFLHWHANTRKTARFIQLMSSGCSTELQGGCAGIPASHGRERAGFSKPCNGGQADP